MGSSTPQRTTTDDEGGAVPVEAHGCLLRREGNIWLLDAGADVAFVKDRLGYANLQNTMVYMRYTTVTRDAQTRQLFASHRLV